MAAGRWQIPQGRPLRIRFGLKQEFVLEGRCLAQNEMGLMIEPLTEIQTFSDFRAVRQFIPYASLIEIKVLSQRESAGVKESRKRKDSRREQVALELEGILSFSDDPNGDAERGPEEDGVAEPSGEADATGEEESR